MSRGRQDPNAFRDPERVEVLRRHQGTQVRRNTVDRAINLHPGDP